MIVARLIDTEGVTITNMALPDDPEHPRWYVYSAVMPKPCLFVGPVDPYVPAVNQIEYRLERRDGGGTYIYRRITPLWE